HPLRICFPTAFCRTKYAVIECDWESCGLTGSLRCEVIMRKKTSARWRIGQFFWCRLSAFTIYLDPTVLRRACCPDFLSYIDLSELYLDYIAGVPQQIITCLR